MNSFSHLMHLAQAAADAPPPAPGGFGPEFFIAMIIFIVAFIFLIQRPQRREQEEKLKAVEGLKKGDAVVSIGGIHGSVVRVDKDKETVIVQVARGVELEFNKSAVNPWKPAAKPAAAADPKAKQAAT